MPNIKKLKLLTMDNQFFCLPLSLKACFLSGNKGPKKNAMASYLLLLTLNPKEFCSACSHHELWKHQWSLLNFKKFLDIWLLVSQQVIPRNLGYCKINWAILNRGLWTWNFQGYWRNSRWDFQGYCFWPQNFQEL